MSNVPDLMHANCLGISQCPLGSVTYDLFRALGGTWEREKMAHACGLIENMTKLLAKDLDLESPFHTLTIGMFRTQKSKPKMRLKATQARRYLQIVWRMLQRFPARKRVRGDEAELR